MPRHRPYLAPQPDAVAYATQSKTTGYQKANLGGLRCGGLTLLDV